MNRLQILEERVRAYLGEMGLDPEQSEDGLYLFKYGSTVVMISLFEETEDTFCRFASVMLKDFEPTLELLHRILRLNTEVLFGSFLLFEDNTLSFSATLLGNHCSATTSTSTSSPRRFVMSPKSPTTTTMTYRRSEGECAPRMC